jgi:hypothetical protein
LAPPTLSLTPSGPACNAWELALAWCFVGIPLTWGVIQTCLNALLLFK